MAVSALAIKQQTHKNSRFGSSFDFLTIDAHSSYIFLETQMNCCMHRERQKEILRQGFLENWVFRHRLAGTLVLMLIELTCRWLRSLTVEIDRTVDHANGVSICRKFPFR
jgi:hypothetical protein